MSDFKLGVCMWGFPMEGPIGLKIASEMGLKGAEISLGTYENNYPLTNRRIQEEYLYMANTHNMELTALSVEHLNQFGLKNPLDSRAGIIAMDGCKKAIQAADEMAISVVQLPCFNDGAIRTEEDLKNTCEKVKILCEIAGEKDITIALEHVLKPLDYERLYTEVGCENLKIMFDTQNYHLDCGANTADMLRELYPHVIQIHVKDGYNGKLSGSLLGTGDSGFFETARVIKETKCTKWILLENYYNVQPLNQLDEDQFKIVKKDVEIAKKIFQIQ